MGADINRWLVLGSGPNRIGWTEFAAAHECKIFAMNGSLAECPQPDAYICTDHRFVEEYSRQSRNMTCLKYIGTDAAEKACGSATINGLPVRNVGTWAVYMALTLFKAEEVHVFGIYGVEDKSWSTLSTAPGVHTVKADFNKSIEDALTAQPIMPAETIFKWPHSADRYNVNAAELISFMRCAFPTVTITMHGGGPIAELIANNEGAGI